MRTISVGPIDWDTCRGAYASIPVAVDWAELRLTEDQIAANAIALPKSEPQPFPDPSIFEVRIARPSR